MINVVQEFMVKASVELLKRLTVVKSLESLCVCVYVCVSVCVCVCVCVYVPSLPVIINIRAVVALSVRVCPNGAFPSAPKTHK